MTDDNKILLSHINDLISTVKRGRRFVFTSFLSDEQCALVSAFLNKNRVDFALYGGYDDSERCIIGMGAEMPPDEYLFPIDTLVFDLKGNDDINHRHVLGALMSLGIKRECLGDIVFVDGKCYIFVASKMSDFICMNLSSVSRLNVNLTVCEEKVSFVRAYETICCIVASMRLDCVVSELAKKSRTAATELIESGFVFINGIVCQKKDKTVILGDTLSVRRVGKFHIDSCEGNTKKNRMKLKILKYI